MDFLRKTFSKIKEKKHFAFLFFLAIIIILLVSANLDKRANTQIALAGLEHNLSGFAWSDNIGWVSFNCTDTSSCGTSNYGVNIDASGNFSGFAWSDNIGWISFNPADVAGCPAGNCPPVLNINTGEVSGWAKALTAPGGGGWDGFISLDCNNDGVCGTSDYGVTFSGTTSNGFAWFNVFGWLSWCGSNHCVISSATLSNNPVAVIFSPQDGVQIPNNDDILFSSVGSSDPDGTIEAYEWFENGDCSGASTSTEDVFARPLSLGFKIFSLRVQDDVGTGSSCVATNFEVIIPPPVNGQCGPAHNVSINKTTPPPVNLLCSAGTETVPVWNEPLNRWTWSCMGQFGGTDATNCRAFNSCVDPIGGGPDIICQPGKFESPISCPINCKADFQETI